MKFFSRMLISLCIIALLNVVTAIKADAGEYIGNYCWNFTMTVDGLPASGTIQLGVNHIGGGHYLCSGIITVTDPLSLQVAAFGNVELLENEIRVTLSNQGKKFDDYGNYTVGIDMNTIILDPNTLNGTSEGIGIYYDGIELSEGIVTYTSCP